MGGCSRLTEAKREGLGLPRPAGIQTSTHWGTLEVGRSQVEAPQCSAKPRLRP